MLRSSFALLLAAGFTAAASVAHAQVRPARTLLEIEGNSPLTLLGRTVASIGDFDGDGRPDFAVGSPGWGPTASDSTGRVFVYLGSRGATGPVDLTLTGTLHGALFGWAIAPLGDLNGDGFDDFAVGAPTHYLGSPSSAGSGRVFVYLGSDPPDAIPDLVLDAPMVDSYRTRGFGASLIGFGDYDLDGYPDWAAAFDNTPVRSSGALVFRGGRSLSPAVQGTVFSSGNVRAVLGAPGDFNGDGRPDLAIGVTNGPGTPATMQVYTFLTAGGVFESWASFRPTTQVAWPTSAIGGDFSGDGRGDLLVGQPLAGGGSIHQLFGSSTRGETSMGVWRLEDILPDSFGVSMALSRDATGVDLAIGAPGDDGAAPGAGSVRVYRFEPLQPARKIGQVNGQRAGEYAGWSIAFPGDVDRNGEGDLLIGAPLSSVRGRNSGAARLVTFSPHTLIEPATPREWRAGGTAEARWLGTESARVSLSLDAGTTWTTLADGVGGLAENTLSIAVPDAVTGRARLRISKAGSLGGAVESDDSDADFAIVRPAPAWPAAPATMGEWRAGAGEARLGAALATGDFDGDGISDVAAGAPLADGKRNACGSVRIEWGGASRAAGRLEGEATGDRFGASLAAGGDFDGDGLVDLLVGAPGADAGGPESGEAVLVGAGGAPRLRIRGTRAGETLGGAVTWIPDWNGDGFDDFAVGSPWFAADSETRRRGRVQIFFGGPTVDAVPDVVLGPIRDTQQFGGSLAGLDLNGDGFGDLAVSEIGRTGITRVHVYFGGAAADAKSDLVLRSSRAADRFGEALARAGDLDGDGIDDLLVGAPGATSAHGETGRVFEFAGTSRPSEFAIRVYDGVGIGEDFGAALAAGGDLNGDGRDDFVAGAPLAGGEAGACRMFFGGDDAAADGEWRGSHPGERFASALTGMRTAGSEVRIAAGAPFDGKGRVETLAMPRYAIDAPAMNTAWFEGGTYPLRWRGAEPAEVALSLDAGRTWSVLAASAGGGAENALEIVAPSGVRDSAYVRLRPTRAGIPGEALRGPIAIGHATTVKRFDYAIEAGGIRLTWETAPGLGPQGWRAYRIHRAIGGDAYTQVGPDLETGELFDPDAQRGGRYALGAVDGNGAEVSLATLDLPGPGPALTVWPVPSVGGGAVELSVFPPVDATGRAPADFGVVIHDLNGRAIRRLAGTRAQTRVGELRIGWDRRTERGDAAKPGVYFVRAEAPSAGFRIDRRIVLLR